jgi:hypothetical protein
MDKHPNPADTLLQHAGLHALLLPSWLTIAFSSRTTKMTLLLDITQAAQDRPVLALGLILSILVAVLAVARSTQEYPSELPWVGKDDSKSFAATRATYSSIKNVNKWLAEGYQKVGRISITRLGEPRADFHRLRSILKRANRTSFRISQVATRSSCPTANSSGLPSSPITLQACARHTTMSCRVITPLPRPVSVCVVLTSA